MHVYLWDLLIHKYVSDVNDLIHFGKFWYNICYVYDSATIDWPQKIGLCFNN